MSTFRRDESGCPGDGIPFDVVSTLELDPVWWRNDWDGDTVSPTMLVSPGPGHQQQVLMLSLQSSLDKNCCLSSNSLNTVSVWRLDILSQHLTILLNLSRHSKITAEQCYSENL